MSDEEIQGLVQNAFQKTLKELQENQDNVFNNLELQEKYNRVLKDKIQLKQENRELKKQLESKETQQKEFISWLENKMKETHYTMFEFQAYRLVFEKYKEIVGVKDGEN